MKNEVKFVILACFFFFLSLLFSLPAWKNGMLSMREVDFSCFFFFWSDFSVIYETMLLCFLTHLTSDQADLQSHFHDSWLITSTAELGASMKGPWPPSQHLLRNSLCCVFLAEASPKVEGDSYLPKWEDNRRKNKDENLSSQLNLFRLIPAFGIQAAANPRFP